MPNYGPGTSKRFRKPVTTDNTVISYCEKRNFRHSSDLAEAKIYLFAVLVSFDMPSTNHFFFWCFCSQVGMTMVMVRFLGCLFSDAQSCCIEVLTTFPTAYTCQNRAGHSNQPKNAKKSFSSKLKVFGRKKSRTCQAQINFHDQSRKVKLLVLKLRHFCISHGNKVTLFYEMPINRVRSDVIGVARLRAKYLREYGERGQVSRTLGHQGNEK